ncbi:hypothetical protein GFL09_22410 [Pseudomonas stutzeri]|uniref:Pycsar system effector family protein n=1 Tax=Stutzerimonas TaxID=2901164 RepID=UPI00190D084B|nr:MULTISPECIES: Pycsar system effector family protein [Stutzerimonas]MBK3870400.1 hypothetical protein [Stutzerimonas stutzeri]
MQTEDRIKNLFEILKRIDTYLVSTNQKLAIIISYCAAVLGWLSLNVGKITGLVTHDWISWCVVILLFVIILSSSISLLMAAKILFPVTNSTMERQVDDSLIFYGDISASKGGSGGYHGKVSTLDADDLVKDLSQQVFTVSKILSTKFQSIKTVMLVLIWANFLPVAFLLLMGLLDAALGLFK